MSCFVPKKLEISPEALDILRALLADVKTAPENALMYDWKPGIVREITRVVHRIKVVNP